MPLFLKSLMNEEPGNTRTAVIGLYVLLLIFNVAVWSWAFVAFHRFPVLLGTAFLAYSFGLRHAVDADRFAAIDNVTRKLMQQGKRPVAVGLMFSLGHSTVVIAGAVAIAAAALALQHRIDAARSIGGLIGTSVSAMFLFGIAIVNLVVLQSVTAADLHNAIMPLRIGGANPALRILLPLEDREIDTVPDGQENVDDG
jgi:nickel/cobalt transporter (NiCoT) family protein